MNITRGWEIANEQFKIYKEQNDKLLKSHFVALVSKTEEEVNKNFIKPDVSGEFLPDHNKIITNANKFGRKFVEEVEWAEMTKESCMTEGFIAGAKWMLERVNEGKNFR